ALWPEPNLLGSTPLEKAQIEMWERRLEFQWFMQFAVWFRNSHPMMAPLEKPQSAEAAAKGERAAKYFVKKLDAHLA
ncbi:MAG: glutathione S-transferase family protein, partial [Pseudomonadota bacterium]